MEIIKKTHTHTKSTVTKPIVYIHRDQELK